MGSRLFFGSLNFSKLWQVQRLWKVSIEISVWDSILKQEFPNPSRQFLKAKRWNKPDPCLPRGSQLPLTSWPVGLTSLLGANVGFHYSSSLIQIRLNHYNIVTHLGLKFGFCSSKGGTIWGLVSRKLPVKHFRRPMFGVGRVLSSSRMGFIARSNIWNI